VPTLSDPSASPAVFAPIDAAFDGIAKTLGFTDATARANALDSTTLAKILQDHVLPARKTAADLVAGGASEQTLYQF
jgi:uncharacterized surface protein with fasciclin (FAS1) repeats